jgi:ABC-2 type transport system ATP-binding protein
VESLCDRVGIIREGKLIETGSLSELRHLTRYTVNVETAAAAEGLAEMEGVYNVHQLKAGLTFQVDAPKIGDVVAHMGQYGILKLESLPPTLEDLFMHHYNASGGV